MKGTLKATWEEVMACPVGSKFVVIAPSFTQHIILLRHKRSEFIWKLAGKEMERPCTKTMFISWNKMSGEQWFLLEDDAIQVTSKASEPIDSGIFCTCNGPSKKCDTGFSFSKVYYTCCNCKKEKR